MRGKFILSAYMLAVMLVTGAGNLWAQGLDSLKKTELTGKLEEYFEALKYEDIDVQKAECDFLIETASDPEVRNFIAQTIYSHYIGSKIMGAEAVAVHLADNWFIPGKVRFGDESELYAARIFAEFNRQSQIGMKAPELHVGNMDGQMVGLFGEDDAAKRFRVLYFYDADCSKCRLETILLRNVLETEDFPVDLLAFYVGDDRQEWMDYSRERLTPEGGPASVVHLWDPSVDSDYQRKYGVLQTPRLFLIAPDGTIVGRGLDVRALSQMLHTIFDEMELDYGGEESVRLFDGIFASGDSVEDVMGIADHIAATTLPKGDTVMFRQLSGDLLYYLSSHYGEGYREGMRYHINANISSRPEVWRSSDDSLKVLGLAGMMDELLSKAVPGALIDDVSVPGELSTWKKTVHKTISLRKLKGDCNIVIFFTEGCNVCVAEKAAAEAILAAGHSKDKAVAKMARKTRIFMVNMDRIMAEDPSLADSLFDAFDLSTLPFIIRTDRKGVITGRYLTLR